VTRVASTSTITGLRAVWPWSGAYSPARSHARARATARAASIAFNAAGASVARASIVRETVASEATFPYTPGSARSRATSDRQSPPNATVTARSRITLAGSWIANGLRHGDRACDNAVPSPVVVMVWVSSTPPA